MGKSLEEWNDLRSQKIMTDGWCVCLYAADRYEANIDEAPGSHVVMKKGVDSESHPDGMPWHCRPINTYTRGLTCRYTSLLWS